MRKYQILINNIGVALGDSNRPYLPGDIPSKPASQFGFAARGPYSGQGDGNGLIEGNESQSSGPAIGTVQEGEPILFWMDLTSAGGQNINLIEGNFNTNAYLNIAALTGGQPAAVFPAAKIGQGNFIYVYSGGTSGADGINYYGMSVVTQIEGGGPILSNAGLTVPQAYAIDSKMDDGLPQTGRVIAAFYNQAASGSASYSNSAVTDNSTTCFNTTTGKYSLSIVGSAPNCGLSFRLQAGD